MSTNGDDATKTSGRKVPSRPGTTEEDPLGLGIGPDSDSIPEAPTKNVD